MARMRETSPCLTSNATLVSALKAERPEPQTRSFVRALREAFPEVGGDEPVAFNRVPDGYVIRKESREVDLFEAEATHPLSKRATEDICRLWFDLDGASIRLSLYIVNRFGHVNQVDLEPWYYLLVHGAAA